MKFLYLFRFISFRFISFRFVCFFAVPGGSRLSQRDEVSKISQRDTSNRNARFTRTSHISKIMLNYHIIVGRIVHHDRPARNFSFRPTGIILVTVRKPWKPKEVNIDKFHSTTLMRVTAAQRCKAPPLHLQSSDIHPNRTLWPCVRKLTCSR